MLLLVMVTSPQGQVTARQLLNGGFVFEAEFKVRRGSLSRLMDADWYIDPEKYRALTYNLDVRGIENVVALAAEALKASADETRVTLHYRTTGLHVYVSEYQIGSRQVVIGASQPSADGGSTIRLSQILLKSPECETVDMQEDGTFAVTLTDEAVKKPYESFNAIFNAGAYRS